jgi:multiple sugar transport system ATP-binding protein
MAQVNIRDVRKSFGSAAVIHGVSIDIADGEFVILVGPSGCGKSTLLRMIAGLENISGGEIRIGPRVVNHVPPKERDIAMVFQNYALYPHMTVADNMGFSLKLKRAPKAEIAAKVNRAAEILGLTALLERYPRQLSGGQRQRVAMGRAIVRDPQVFLFDEPLSNLDAKLRVAMRTEIKALHQRLKTTTVYVTHDQIEAMTMADKIVVMHDGRVEQIGAPLDLYDRPANLFVAGFIGSPAMNFLAGRLEAGAFVTDGGLRLPVAAAPAGSDGRPVIYGVRPEHFQLTSAGVPIEVVVIEPTGSETQVVARVDGQELICVFRERVSARPGEIIHVQPDPALVHLFDPKTERRLGSSSGRSDEPGDHPPSGREARTRSGYQPSGPALGKPVRDRYEPSDHYMRGPGPKTLAKRSSNPSST